VLRLLVTGDVVPTSPIIATLMMEMFGSSETPALTRAKRRNIPEDAILHFIYLFNFHYGINYKVNLVGQTVSEAAL
jgi:hypothetical protein